MDIPASPTRRIQRSLSAVQVLRGDSNSSLVAPQPGIPRADSSLPPLTELSPSAQAARGAWAVVKAPDSSLKDRFAAARVLLFLTFEDPTSSKVAWCTSFVLMLAILVNCVAFIAGSLKHNMVQPTDCKKPVCVPGPDSICTEPVCYPREKDAVYQVELWTIVIFTIDYLVRILTVHAVPPELINPRSFDITVDGRLVDRAALKDSHGVVKTLKYMAQWLNIIDVISIVPFYIHMAYAAQDTDDLGVLRILRLFRVVRIFKLGRYSEGGMLLGRTLKASVPALVLFVFLTTILTIVFGSLMYFFEMGTFMVTPAYPHGAFFRPNARNTGYELSPFNSILMGIYWTVVNTTTLGNAALYPTTTLGRITSCIVAYTGILCLALPISIVGKCFTEQYNLIYGTYGGAFENGGANKASGGGGTALPGLSSSGPSLLSITAGIDKNIAASLSAQGTPNSSVRIRRQTSSRRMGRSRSNSGIEDIFAANQQAQAGVSSSRPNSRTSTPQTLAAGGGALPYPYGTVTTTGGPASGANTPGGPGAFGSNPGGLIPVPAGANTPARPLRAPGAMAVAGTPGPAGAVDVENDNSTTTTTTAAVARAGAFQSLAVTELQAQLRALREELAALAPLKQEVDALRGQLRELQQKQ